MSPLWRTDYGHSKKMQVLWGVVRTTRTLSAYSSERVCTTNTVGYFYSTSAAHSAGNKSSNTTGTADTTTAGLCRAD